MVSTVRHGMRDDDDDDDEVARGGGHKSRRTPHTAPQTQRMHTICTLVCCRTLVLAHVQHACPSVTAQPAAACVMASRTKGWCTAAGTSTHQLLPTQMGTLVSGRGARTQSMSRYCE